MGRQTNVKNVFEKERKNKGERKETRRGRSVEGMEGPMMAVSLYSVYDDATHFILTKQSE